MRNYLQHLSLLWYFAIRIITPLSLTLLGSLFIGAVVYQQLVVALVFDRDSELGDLAAWDLRIELGEYSALLRQTSRDPALSSLVDGEPAAALHAVVTSQTELFDGLALLDVDGTIVASMPEDIAQFPQLTNILSDFRTAPAPIDSLISNVLMDPRTGESMVVLAVPLPGASGGADGAADMLLGYVRVRGSDMIELMERLTVGGSGYAYLVDRNGRVIYHPDVETLGDDFSDRDYVRRVKAGEAGGALWDAPTGERWIVDYSPITEAGWGVVVKEPREQAMAPATFYGRLLIGLGIFVIGLVFFLLWIGVRGVATPIGWLAQQTARLAAGEEVKYTQLSGITEIDSLGRAFERMAEQIVAYRSSLRLYIGLITQSQEDERRRIARELHDDTVQNLISIARRIELLKDSIAEPQVRNQWAALREMVAATARGVRQITLDLRPPVLEDLGLVNALHMLADSKPADGVATPEILFTVGGEPLSLASDLELMFFRIAQEALSNIRRHAMAWHAKLHLEFADKAVQLTVKDDGVGFNLPYAFTELVQRGSLGLMGIQERVWAANGTLVIQSQPGAGTYLQVTIPIGPESIRREETT